MTKRLLQPLRFQSAAPPGTPSPGLALGKWGPASDAQRHYVQSRLYPSCHSQARSEGAGLDIMFCCVFQPASQRGGAGGGGDGKGSRVAVREVPARTPLRSAPACAGLARKVTGPTLCPCHRSVPGGSDATGSLDRPSRSNPPPGHKEGPIINRPPARRPGRSKAGLRIQQSATSERLQCRAPPPRPRRFACLPPGNVPTRRNNPNPARPPPASPQYRWPFGSEKSAFSI